MVHGTSIKLNYYIQVDKKLDKYDDIYPINSKLRYDFELCRDDIINPNFNLGQDGQGRFQYPQELSYAIDFNKEMMRTCELNELKGSGISIEMIEKYVDVLFYGTKIKTWSDEKIKKYLEMSIPEDEYSMRIEHKYAMNLKRLMKNKEYYKEIKKMEDELTNTIEFTEKETEILNKLRNELNSRGINIVKEYFKFYNFNW